MLPNAKQQSRVQDVVPFKCKGINFQQFIGDTELSFIPFGVDILVFSFIF